MLPDWSIDSPSLYRAPDWSRDCIRGGSGHAILTDPTIVFFSLTAATPPDVHLAGVQGLTLVHFSAKRTHLLLATLDGFSDKNGSG
jgi:hypothetical protein